MREHGAISGCLVVCFGSLELIMNREEFLAQRRKGIGGSDISALLGLNPWKSSFGLYLDKTGRLEENLTPEQEERMKWGTILEDVIAKDYAEQQGVKIQRINQQMTHPKHDCIVANVDRVVLDDGARARFDGERVKGANKVLEVKTANAFAMNSDDWGDEGSEVVPTNYWLQVMWYMGITQLPVADIAVLFGGQRQKVFTVGFDKTVFDDLVSQAVDWWQKHIVADMPPEPTNEYEAKLKWAKSNGAEIQVTSDELDLINSLKEIRLLKNSLEEEEKELRDKLIPALQDGEIIMHGAEKLGTYKSNKDSIVTDWKSAYESLAPDAEHIKHYQTVRTGARILRI